jgi:dynein regulatory complex protein 1
MEPGELNAMLNSSDREERIVARRAVSDTPPQTHAHRHTPPTVFPPPPLFSPLPHGRTAILGSFPFSPHPPVPTPHHQPNHVQRIAARLAAKRESAEGGKNGEGERLEDIGVAKRQIGESKKRLARIKSAGSEDVSLVRVQQDDRENLRRVAEESRRQELRGKLLTEAEHSARRNATVAMRWADLFSVEVPQELYEEIERQRAQCNKITASKDKLIAEIKNELKAKDDEYVKSLKKQAEDIDQLLLHMGQQFKDLQGAYLEELEEIEQAFLSQRGELISANKGEINVLFEKRHTLEQAFMELMAERAEHYQTELERHRVNDAEEYNILKIRLETDVQNLEQHLEAMRATYQLNTEKLEYNYRVLVERDHENQSTISQQRRKIARQRESLLALKSRYADSDKKFQDENVRLTEEYRRVTEQFKDLQAKYRHFELADIRKFQEVWAMNEETVAAKVKRVLNADRVLHEQQMGLTWHAPSDDVFKPPEQLALDAAKKKRAAAAAAAKAAKAAAAAKAGEEGGEGGEGGEEGGEAGGEAEVDEADAEEENPFEQRLADPAYADFLAKLTDETGFLIEAKVHRAIDAARRAEADEAAAEAAEAAYAAAGGGGGGGGAPPRGGGGRGGSRRQPPDGCDRRRHGAAGGAPESRECPARAGGHRRARVRQPGGEPHRGGRGRRGGGWRGALHRQRHGGPRGGDPAPARVRGGRAARRLGARGEGAAAAAGRRGGRPGGGGEDAGGRGRASQDQGAAGAGVLGAHGERGRSQDVPRVGGAGALAHQVPQAAGLETKRPQRRAPASGAERGAARAAEPVPQLQDQRGAAGAAHAGHLMRGSDIYMCVCVCVCVTLRGAR